MSDKFRSFVEAENYGRNAGIVIGLVIAAVFYFLFIAKNAKYEGLTAKEWANDFYDVVGCVEDKASYNDNPMECL